MNTERLVVTIMNTKIIIAKSAGFCFGVRRAITLAEKTAGRKRTIYTLGPLIHNPQEVQRLARRGIKLIKDPARLKEGTLILRTHGIPAAVRRRLETKKVRLVDATCPFVKRAQDIVQELTEDDVQVVIVGEKTHPEVVALVSYGRGKCRVVEKPSDARKLKLEGRVFVVSQTTQTPENFKTIARYLKNTHANVSTFNTICRATIDRQNAASRLARRVEAMIVVGGKNSGNTRRLAQICRARARTHHIETAAELKAAWFKGVRRIGLTAGASTPDWIIQEVKGTIEGILEKC
ncbi:MAG: 4-hydroxy-3-methylbut-2-enyl diphosphate reductase [Endomicrobiales bacterium]